MATAGPPDVRVPGYLGRVLDGSGRPVGTCFQVTPGVLVTAWHVLEIVGAAAEGAEVGVDPLPGGAAAVAAVVRLDQAHDLAVLACDVHLPASIAGLAATGLVEARTPVTVTGHCVIDDPGRTMRWLTTTGQWAGPVAWEDAPPAGRMTADALLPGMSGAPVIRDSDNAVLGVVSGRYNSADGWLAQTVWVARAEDLAALLDGIADVPVMHVLPPARLRTWRVCDFSPEIAGIHPAVGAVGLPRYVPRQHDGEVRRRLRAAGERGGFVLLTGSSCSGKTRSAWEAVRAEFGESDLRLVWPRDAAELAALLTVPAGPIIVWLDETQRYLSADVLAHDLRTDRQGLVLVGTMWQSDYARLTERSADRPGDGQARDLLDVAGAPVQVGDTLTPEERTDAQRVAATDPIVAEALRNREFGLTQTLAGGPWLVQRWQQPAFSYTTAVITAAMDLGELTRSGERTHRRGEPSPIFGLVDPAALREAAPAYFPDRRPAPAEWYERAINEATTLIREAVSPLIPIRHHNDPARTAGFLVADFLVDHRRRRTAPEPIPEQTWDALIRNTDDDEILRGVAHQATDRHLMRQAEASHRRAGKHGVWGLIFLLRDQGRRAELETLMNSSNSDESWRVELLREFGRTDELTRLAEAGSVATRAALADERLRQGDISGAIAHLQKIPDGYYRARLPELILSDGDPEAAINEVLARAEPTAMIELAGQLAERGLTTSAMTLLERAVRTPDQDNTTRFADIRASHVLIRPAGEALIKLARLQIATGDAEAAVDSLSRLAEQDYPDAREELSRLLLDRGDLATLAERARAGDQVALRTLVGHLEEQDDRSGAVAVVDECVASASDPDLRRTLGCFLIHLGEIERGSSLVNASDGNPSDLARALVSAGRESEAIDLLRDAVRANPTPWRAHQLDRLLRSSGRDDEADEVLRTFADQGHPWAVVDYGDKLAEQGEKDQAIELFTAMVMSNPPDLSHPQPRGGPPWDLDDDNYWAAEDSDYGVASSRLANLLYETGRRDDLRRLAEVDPGQRWRYADLLGKLGDEEGLRRLARINSPNADWRLTDLLGARRDLDGLYAEAAEGSPRAVDVLVEIYLKEGSRAKAVRQLRVLADNGHSYAQRRLIDLLAEQGYVDEAVRLLTRQIVCGISDDRELIQLLTTHRRTRELDAFKRYGLNPDGSIADRF